MAGQSLAMGEAFGKGFQYGKRKISSMSNEEFNALNFKGLSESIATDYQVMIPSLQQSIRASDRLQSEVFQALGKVILDIPREILDFIGDVGKQIVTGGGTSKAPIQIEQRTGIGNPTVAQLVNPDAIRANIALWEKLNLVKKGTTQVFEEQLTTATETATQKSRDTSFQEGFQGPTKTPRNIKPPLKTGLHIVDGKLINVDLRPQEVKDTRVRAPKSIVNQLRKYQEEIRALDSIIRQLQRTGGRTGNKNQILSRMSRKTVVLKNIKALTRKYKLNDADLL